ncbi:MAG: hypothetical protein JNL80_07230 [Phycisphaerae bacterium]|jgi:hypothetical protein|nr:hypothetical protein [Phycisphaerae bacterium]
MSDHTVPGRDVNVPSPVATDGAANGHRPASHRGLGRARIILLGAVGIAAVGSLVPSVLAGGRGGQVQVPTTAADFIMPGTQPTDDPYLLNPITVSSSCTYCHSDYNAATAPFDTWAVSLMGQSARDPIWQAALTIANQDANGVGEICIRCHSPGAWLAGRASTGTTDEFLPEDWDSINCAFCHRMVNPILGPDSAVAYPGDPANPDDEIIADLVKANQLPFGAGDGRYVVDPADARRGPFDDVPLNLHGLSIIGEQIKLVASPFHKKSELCGTCHDVSNPVYMKQKNGTYGLGRLNAPHPTQNPHDMFPEQRTYSEWALSEFASDGVVFADNRFGGPDHPTGVMSSCQDCHMPVTNGGACAFADSPPFFYRDVAAHSFSGSNSWVMSAIKTQLGEDAEWFGLTQERVDASIARNIQMLRDASDMEVTQSGNQVKIRVINQTGHKLPTGYPEGRMMWLNVKFLNAKDQVIDEVGGYDYDNAEADLAGTKVWEAIHGIDAAIAKATGLPEGPSTRLALANTKYKDNRIPPRGYNAKSFAAVGAPVIGATYADGQYWDDTFFTIPSGAAKTIVTLYYQTSTKEYMEFLRDDNLTDDRGQTAYDLWATHGKSAPVDMDSAQLTLAPVVLGDLNGDGFVNGADLAILLGAWGGSGLGDLNGDNTVNGADLAILLGAWTS